ncbi:MAG: hypothetical protein COY78_03740 [Candidatus Omnitrophica bacterium CG_4_10_14_0_8_um_filter_44_12]|nr:MAG: hypothetical protein COY78_03740 [Candidatus Omnitrophica bacterium CG_4_10_14_0_8_um_filter_44_12]
MLNKIRIAVLRETLDTTSETFLFQELGWLKHYLPFFIYKNEARKSPEIDAFKIDSSKKRLFNDASSYEKFKAILDKHEANLIEKIINIRKPKLIQCPFLTDAAAFIGFIKKTNLPVFVAVRGFDLYKGNNSNLVRELLPYVSKFIAKSRSISNTLVSLGCPPEKIEVIHSGVDLTELAFKPRALDKKKLKILSCGRFVEKKGFEATLLFFKKFLIQYPRATLTLIGEGPLELKIRRLVNRYHLGKSINIKSVLPHRLYINELYKHDIFVLPSQIAKDGDREGIPNVLKEAMASGMPVISTNHSGIPELIQDRINGHLVNEGDYSAIAAIADSLIKDSCKTGELCWRARFTIEKYFDLADTAGQLESQYDRILMPDFARSIRDMIDGKKPLKFRADLHLTAGCNNKCIMCDNWKNPVAAPMAKKEVLKLLKDLKSFGVNYIRFHGQEPLLRKDIFSIMEIAKKLGFFIGIKTNALLIDKINIRRLCALIDNLYLSLDSHDKAVHNYLRGNTASFDKNIGLVKEIKAKYPDIKVFLNSVVTGKNLIDLDRMLDLAKELDVDRVSFVHLNRNNKDDLSNVALKHSQMEHFYLNVYPKILLKSIKYNIPVQVDPILPRLAALENKEQLASLLGQKRNFASEIKKFAAGSYGEDFYKENICYGVFDHVTIDWEGNVYPCCAMPRKKETAIGNIRRDPFLTIWESERYVNYRANILEGRCAYKNNCSRNFKETAIANDCLRRPNDRANGIFTHYTNQFIPGHIKQAEKFKRILAYSFLYSKFYKNKLLHLPGILNDQKNKIDFFVGKNELKHSFSSGENTPNYFNEDYCVYRTSTCGENAFLYARPHRSEPFDRMAVSFLATGKWKYCQPWIKLTSENCIEASYPVWGKVSDEKYKNIDVLVIPAYEDFLKVGSDEIKRIYHMILDSKANFIHANPTYLKLLLYRFSLDGIFLPKGRFSVHSTYENFLPSTINFIRRYLSCECFDQYGCSEVGPISFTCSKGNRHIFSDSVKVDVERTDSLKRKDAGRVIITSLENTVMPIVRYFNGDYALRLNKARCNCGLKTPIMGQILGRESEIIEHRGNAIFPLDIDNAFIKEPNLLLYQAIYGDAGLRVKYIPAIRNRHIDIIAIKKSLINIFKDDKLPVDFEVTGAILPSHRGKFKTVVINKP